MQYNANDYLRRMIKKHYENISDETITSYEKIFSGCLLYPGQINSHFILQIGVDFQDHLIKTYCQIDNNGNLTIKFGLEYYKNIQYAIGFDSEHYELSLIIGEKGNYEIELEDFNRIAGVYYINRNISGLTKYKYYDYETYKYILDNLSINGQSFFYYNPNELDCNGFNPDLSYQESGDAKSSIELAQEINEFIKNCDIKPTVEFANHFLNNHEKKESSKELILK